MLRCRARSWHETDTHSSNHLSLLPERAAPVWPPAEGAVDTPQYYGPESSGSPL